MVQSSRLAAVRVPCRVRRAGGEEVGLEDKAKQFLRDVLARSAAAYSGAHQLDLRQSHYTWWLGCRRSRAPTLKPDGGHFLLVPRKAGDDLPPSTHGRPSEWPCLHLSLWCKQCWCLYLTALPLAAILTSATTTTPHHTGSCSSMSSARRSMPLCWKRIKHRATRDDIG